MTQQLTVALKDESKTVALAKAIVQYITQYAWQSMVFYLKGELGAGKTTFCRAIIQGLGYQGHVKSPTYALVESYHLKSMTIHHFDLYRLASPDELEFIGIRDFFNTDALLLIEWPEKGIGALAKPDLIVDLTYDQQQRSVTLTGLTTNAQSLLDFLVENKNEL